MKLPRRWFTPFPESPVGICALDADSDAGQGFAVKVRGGVKDFWLLCAAPYSINGADFCFFGRAFLLKLNLETGSS